MCSLTDCVPSIPRGTGVRAMLQATDPWLFPLFASAFAATMWLAIARGAKTA